jgi:uncharacterized membrane protein YkvA (DUF1232 family)
MTKIAKQKEHGVRPVRRQRSELKDRLRSFLMFLPNMVMLLGRLLKDSRVPTAEKALFAAAVVYVISPLDLIPDVFPFIGQVDDLYVVALVLLRLINKSDDRVVRQHWSGGGDVVALADSIAALAPKFLPRRVSRILTSRVEMAPAGDVVSGLKNGDRAVVRVVNREEIPDPDALSDLAH